MSESDLTAAFIGCGNMGSAVLDGLLDAIRADDGPTPPRISRFIAYTHTPSSAQRLHEKYGSGAHAPRVRVLHARIVDAIRPADVVVLGFKPYMARAVLGAAEVRRALRGKLVVSMLAGLSAAEVRGLCGDDGGAAGPVVAKAVPNVAARCRRSMTILESPEDGAVPPREAELVEWLFGRVGSVKWVAAGLVNAGSMLMTACLAALSVPVEGLLDGSVAEGLRRADAMEIAVQGIYGLGAMLAAGVHPAVVRETISSPRGCTIQSLLTVEKAATRAVFAQALIDGTRHLQPANDKR